MLQMLLVRQFVYTPMPTEHRSVTEKHAIDSTMERNGNANMPIVGRILEGWETHLEDVVRGEAVEDPGGGEPPGRGESV